MSRLSESAAVMQWIKIIQNRRNSNRGDVPSDIPWVTEKEFLLTHAQSVKANPNSISPEDGEVDLDYTKWIGNATLIKPEGDLGNPRKLIFNHHEWPDHPMPPGLDPHHQCAQGLQPNFLG